MNGGTKNQCSRRMEGHVNGAPDEQLKDGTERWKNGETGG